MPTKKKRAELNKKARAHYKYSSPKHESEKYPPYNNKLRRPTKAMEKLLKAIATKSQGKRI